jgi:hypothetical protein
MVPICWFFIFDNRHCVHKTFQNIWLIEFGMIACICSIPLALIAGPIRGIPLFWQVDDSSIGISGIISLNNCRNCIKN